jgi:hypothetical protein
MKSFSSIALMVLVVAQAQNATIVDCGFPSDVQVRSKPLRSRPLTPRVTRTFNPALVRGAAGSEPHRTPRLT